MASAKADCEEGEAVHRATDHAVSEPGRSAIRDLEARIRAMLHEQHNHQAEGRGSKPLSR